LRPRIGDFRQQYPEIEVCISAYRLLREAELNNFDFVITYGPGNFPSWHAEKFLSVEAFPVCSPALLRAKHPLRTPADLAHHTLLHDECSLSDSQSPDWGKWLQLAGADNVDATRGPTFTPGNLALDAAVDGSGVALAKGVLVEDDLAAGRLVRPFEVELKLDFAYWLHYPTTLDNSYRINALRRWLASQTNAAAVKEPIPLPPKVVVQVNESAFLS
jgi:LysR family glycine cleavage system transcriptional activator